MLLKTSLFDIHLDEGGRMVDFAGWEMPLQYASITGEHMAVRTATGLFDVGHMGRFWFSGAQAGRFLDRFVVSRVADLPVGQAKYTVVCNEQGRALDDILITRLEDERWVAVVNASNRKKLLDWFQGRLSGDTEFADRTMETGMIAIQGGEAIRIASELVGRDVGDLGYFNALALDNGVLISRTGYTGEDGFELIAPNGKMPELWRKARKLGALPAGLGARDSLRLEMGFPLYGHELTEEITPFEAGLKRIVDLDKPDFIGKTALETQQRQGVPRTRIAFLLEAPGVPRQDCLLIDGDRPIGKATSGGFSPVLKKGIGLALVDSANKNPESLSVEIRGKRVPARKVKLPFVEKRVKA